MTDEIAKLPRQVRLTILDKLDVYYMLLNSDPALALAKPSQAKQRLRWHYIHSETADPATGHWARTVHQGKHNFNKMLGP